MKKYLSFLFGFAFLFSIISTPLSSTALSPICPVGYTYVDSETGIDCVLNESACVDLKYNLKLTNRDIYTNGEVTKLQNFLASQGFFKESATGYFGLLTVKAVAEFQKATNISPAVGYVGPVTRAKIKALTCGDQNSTKPEIIVTAPNGGETWEINMRGSEGPIEITQDDFEKITWTTKNVTDSNAWVNISLEGVGTISAENAKKGFYDFFVSPTTGSLHHTGGDAPFHNIKNLVGDNHKIKLSLYTGDGFLQGLAQPYPGYKEPKLIAEDVSNKTFKIVCPAGYVANPILPVTISAINDIAPTPCIINENVCPTGTTGTYPNCKKINECPAGYYGTYPDCKIAFCDYARPPEGCNYVKGPDYNPLNQCGMVLKCVEKSCPEGTTGTYPNCVKDTNPPTSCVELSNNLILTDKDANKNGEVTNLQNFLISQGYLKESATGYFGVATLAGVIKFQKENNISPAIGYVGELTRAKIKALTCSGENSNKPEITVISPNGGESWKASDTAKITWTTKNAPADSWVALFLQNKEEHTQLLTQKLAVNGSYDYLVAETFCAGDACYPDPINGDFKIIARLYTGVQELCGGFCYFAPGTRIEPILIAEDKSDKSFKINSEIVLDPVCPTGTTGTYPNCVTTVTTKPTITFTANPTGVEQGKNTILTWSSTNATSCTASGGWTGAKAISGSQLISNLQTTTTFTLTCTGGTGEKVSKSVDVGVYIVDDFPDTVCSEGTTGTYPNCVTTVTPKPTVNLTANPTSLQYGGSTKITWSSTNATSCTASEGWTGTKATNGSQIISNLQTSTSYTLTCTGAGGTVSGSVFVGVYIVDDFPDTVCPTGTTGTYPNCVNNTTYPPGCASNAGYSATTGQPCGNTTTGEASTDKTPRVAIWGGKVSQYLNNKGYWISDLDSSFVHTNEILNFCQKWYPSTTSYTYYKNELISNWVNLSTGAEEFFYTPHFSYKCVGGVQPNVLGASTITENPSNSCSVSQTLMKGMNNSEVKCLQQKLNQKGYTVSGTEGGKEVTQFGLATLSALKKFQLDNSLKADGILGLQTRTLLNK